MQGRKQLRSQESPGGTNTRNGDGDPDCRTGREDEGGLSLTTPPGCIADTDGGPPPGEFQEGALSGPYLPEQVRLRQGPP
jgi:hypothetical protein